MIFRILTVVLILAYAGTAESYGSLRCKGKIIDVGMSMNKVLTLCGEPGSRQVEQTPVRSRNAAGFSRFIGVSYAELWRYNRGWGKFPVVLRFQDDILKRVVHESRRSGVADKD